MKGIDDQTGYPKFKKATQTFTKVEWDNLVNPNRNPGFWIVEVINLPDGFNKPNKDHLGTVLQPPGVYAIEGVDNPFNEKPKQARTAKK